MEAIDLASIKTEHIFKQIANANDHFLYTKTSSAWKLLKSNGYQKALIQSQVILDRTWEHLNTGYWKDVKLFWRQLYTFASLIKSVSLYHLGDIESSLKTCDMGLLMGAPIFNNILNNIATTLSKLHKDNVIKYETILDESTCSEPSFKKFRRKGAISLEENMQESCLIEKVDSLSLLQFKEEYMQCEKPVIIKNCMSHWPAMSHNRWCVEYLQKIAGSRTVPVEIGDKYTSESWTQKLMTINEFVNRYILTRTNIGYLAQHQLFEQIPELQGDIIIPDYCCLSELDEECPVLTHAWFGPENTVSPLHHDPYQNLLSQVMGSKYVRLYDQACPHMYPNVDSILDNTSQVDLEDIDVGKFPKFTENRYFECVLNEGEMLYIPYKWWHFVKSLSTSFSVSFWWK